ncbi:MAG: TolB family protein [Bacteroidota bacterium]
MFFEKNKLFVLFLLSSILGYTQTPDSDIWLFRIKKSEKGIEFQDGINITNRVGYDNQPFFTPDNKFILFTSIREENQSDIYKYGIKSKKTNRVTATTVSEYSPMLTNDGSKISVVVVEKDSTQRIWQFDAKEKKDKKPYAESDQVCALTEVDSVGYYAWLNHDTLIYYKLTNPHSIHVYAVSEKRDVFLGNEPSRSFKPCGFRKFFYVLKRDQNNELRVYDWAIRRSDVLALTSKENEDFIWSNEFGFMKSENDKLFRLDSKTKDWMEWANFSANGIKKITRFALSSDGKWLAVVSVN